MELLNQYKAIQSHLSETLALVGDTTSNLPVTFRLHNTLGNTEFTLNVPIPEYVPNTGTDEGGDSSGNNNTSNTGSTSSLDLQNSLLPEFISKEQKFPLA